MTPHLVRSPSDARGGSVVSTSGRPAERSQAIVDLRAIEANAQTLKSHVGGDVELCAVVKADAYGHGVGPSATAALRGGATRLAVATAREAQTLARELPGVPLLVLGALTESELDQAISAGADIAVWRKEFGDLCARKAHERGAAIRVHLKYDSGMGRLGERDPSALVALADAVSTKTELELAGVWTHFATADEMDNRFFDQQLDDFSHLADRVRPVAPECIVHAANSAATLREPRAHFDMVRCGIALYGLDPFQGDPLERGLVPALELRSYVADVKRLPGGTSVGYGRTWRTPADTYVGLIPIGYGDGVPRALSEGGEVLVRGVRRPVAGLISMDNLAIDLGSETDVEAGDEVVLIGPQGKDRIRAEDIAASLGTINYEIACSISARVPRVHER